MTRRVAITGFSFRFPGTNNSQYWQNLLDGRNLVTQVDATRWAQDSLYHPNKNHPGSSYTFSAGSIGDVSAFDAAFFGISPREAAQMDPQQRLLLEMSWEALENSGIKPSSLRGSACGVFIGIASTDYAYRLADDFAAIDSLTATGNTASIAANRISYVLDLRGPSMAIDTACSSSMVAFHQACQSILSGESVQALVGGVSLHLHPYGFMVFSKASMLSPRGLCNVFDASGDGYVRSEGGGIFFLKDYDQAIADGNPIWAVVANSAVNTDGRKSGLTVPNPEAQAALLKQVYADAGIAPDAIDYIEAHGTGTAVGDPIEARALADALGQYRAKASPLLIGSVKSNLGHLEAASGVAGLVKALYCLRHRAVPATIGMVTPNPHIHFDAWNLAVATETVALKPTGKLVVGINSFGFGGANAHVILESHEATIAKLAASTQTDALPLLLSAKDPVALRATARDFAAFLSDQPDAALYDIAYHAWFRRDWHEHRALVYGTSCAATAKALLAFADDHDNTGSAVVSAAALPAPAGLAFVYSGNGCQWLGMGKQLLAEPLFRATIQEIDQYFSLYANFSLEDELAGDNDRYAYTEIAQPALFAVQVGITQLLRARGLDAVAVAGHSVGEVAAAWAAGALTLPAAVEVIYQRSRLQGLTKGSGMMTAVGLGQAEAVAILAEFDASSTLVLAGINSSNGVTVAGSADDLTILETLLNQRGIFNKRLDLDYAFHSPAMDSIAAELKQALSALAPVACATRFYSGVSGTQIEGNALDAAYWWANIRQPVQFESAVKHLLASGATVLLEIGPHAVLRGYLKDGVKTAAINASVITTVMRGDDAPQRVADAASLAVLAGAAVNGRVFFPRVGAVVDLPNYLWQRERHWHTVTPESMGLLERYKIHPLLGYPLRQHELTWENQLDTKLNPVLADHAVGEAIVFPGAGFCELALAAAFAWHPGDLAEIEELEIYAPLLLGHDHTKRLRLSIAAADGCVAINARDNLSAEPWTLHAAGRILREPSDILLRQERFSLPTRPADFSGASHQALALAVGLAYGPSFQCIDRGWIVQNSVWAVFKIPDSIVPELAHSYLHPALLDCCFQLVFQLLKEAVAAYDGITFIPTQMGRISFFASPARPGFARATLLRRTQRALVADFTVFDTDGKAIAVIKNTRFRSIRLGKNAADHLRFLDYHAVPTPRAAQPDLAAVVTYSQIQMAFAELARRAALKGSHRRYSEEVDPLLDSLCSRFTRQALQLLAADGVNLSHQAMLSSQADNPECAPFIAHLLAMAESDQTIAPTPEGWQILPEQDIQASAQDIWNSLVADYPDYFQIIHSVGRIGMHLKALLDGSLSLAQLCPQESSLASLMRQVLGASGKQKVGQTLRDLLVQGIAQLPEGQRLGLVEISAGFPAFAMDVCVAMDFVCCDYIFASTQATTLEELGRLQERFPDVDTRLIDTDNELAGLIPHCQIAIVTLDFNTLEEALAAVAYARACLLPGGTLMLIGQHPSRWIDFVFGGQRSHWLATEQGLGLSNQRTTGFWHLQLQQLEFTNTDLFELSPDTLSGPYLLLAQLSETALSLHPSAVAMPRSWVLLADASGYSSQLSDALTKKLQERGDLVVQASADDALNLESLLLDTTASYGQLDGIVHLAGLVPQSVAAAEQVLAQQVNRCAWAARIIQATEASQTATTCWLVTTGTAGDLLPGRAGSIASIPVDAALWGFGRTLINEATNCAVRLVDLADLSAIESVATALDHELEAPDAEQEVLLTQHGARYAPRLRLAARPTSGAVAETDAAIIRLGFQFPGQLRNLRWEAHPSYAPADDEIEVDVHASGLNFRDVMFALGLLSDEAIENGFSGPTLGLEFSGIVRSVGSRTSGFAPGDLVVGFGASSFGNRVVTKASAISHIPPKISFEAAATIPSTFFTVYYALHYLARMQPGEKILIHGAAGGVGIAAIQIAKWLGAEIFATAGSDEKRDFLRLLGVDHVFDSRSLAFADEILAQTQQQGVDVVLNSLAGEAINRNFRVLKPFGRFLELGKRDFYENTKVGLRPFRNNISYFGIDADQLMQVRPELTRSLFAELMALFVEGVLHPLPYHVFAAEDIVDAFRYMQQARQIGKIIVTYRNGISHVHALAPPRQQHLQLASEATFLVTGGLSGFGLRTAQWLVGLGTRHLVLISRSGAESLAAQEAVADMQAQGVTVWARACDVTQADALAALLAEMADGLPPLKGIVHAATVIEDGLVRTMDAGQLQRVLAPKVLGAQYLHELTQSLPLAYFILFSSATTLFGNPGQGNYVAANASLEALAQHRRSLGLPATCVRWGAIDDVGFLARNEKLKAALQSRMGGSAIQSAVALDVLASLLLNDRSGLGVMELDWNALARFLPSADSPKFSELARSAGQGDGDDVSADDIQRTLAELSDADLLATLIDMLKSEVGEILRIAPDKIDATRSIYEMGLDSLMGVELVVALESRFGTRLPVMALSQSPTITKLAERIIVQLKGYEDQDLVTEAQTALAQTQQLAAQHGSEESAAFISDLVAETQARPLGGQDRMIP